MKACAMVVTAIVFVGVPGIVQGKEGNSSAERPREPSEFSLRLSAADWQDEAAQSSGGQGKQDAAEEAAPAASDSEALAKKLTNPIADLISVPFQMNFNFGGGVDIPERYPLLKLLPRPASRLANRLLQEDRDQAFRFLMNVQPVIPISLSEDWNVISRTIVPVIYQDDLLGTTSQGGLGDTVQSLFFSPKPFTWGVGPVFLLPTATDHDELGAYRWGAGPTGVILRMNGPWTYGALANHIWSFARDDGRSEINATYLQPFLAHTFKTATTLSANTESTYDWIEDQWTVPLFGGVSQLIKIGKLPVQFQLGGQYWVEAPDSAPDWSVRFQVTLLFPK